MEVLLNGLHSVHVPNHVAMEHSIDHDHALIHYLHTVVKNAMVQFEIQENVISDHVQVCFFFFFLFVLMLTKEGEKLNLY